MRTHYAGSVCIDQLGQTVSLCGWVHRRRDHGGVIFIDLRDREGLIQVVCDPDRADMFKIAETLRNEFCIQVSGLVRPRPQGTVNTNLKSGEIEVLCQSIQILNAISISPDLISSDKIAFCHISQGQSDSGRRLHGLEALSRDSQ